jgi:hypothetical protein
MSYSKEVYVGVYIECKNPSSFKFEGYRSVVICPNEYHDEEYTDLRLKFCPLCGEEMEHADREYYRNSKVYLQIPEWLEDVMLNINQIGIECDKDIYIVNSDICNIKCDDLEHSLVFELDYFHSYLEPFSENKIIKYYEEFTSNDKCMEFLELCRSIYGDQNVFLKFGTIVYYI